MSIESDLVAVLTNVCPRVFPDFAPVKTTRPYVTFQQVGGHVINPLDRTVPDKQHGEFQVNVWANSRKSAASLMLQIDTALRTATQFVGKPVSAPVSDFDADVPVYGSRQDWSVWSAK